MELTRVHNRILALNQLGNLLNALVLNPKPIENILNLSKQQNPWFTKASVLLQFAYWSNNLQEEKLLRWLKEYELGVANKNIGIVMAGNIPLVGFHDLICVLLAGHKAKIKLSSKDSVLMEWMVAQLININPEFKARIQVIPQLNSIDAVIATGSNNTARYFDSYFGHLPNLIRKNRTSIAVLNGLEDKAEMHLLGKDIFDYFGLGCRNVTQVFAPKDFEVNKFFEAIFSYKEVIQHHKYANNYSYNRTIFLMKQANFLDNNFLLVQKSNQLFSPIATINWHEYKNESEVEEFLQSNQRNIQCIVGKKDGWIDFGKSQQPKLSDYADGLDVLQFLTTL